MSSDDDVADEVNQSGKLPDISDLGDGAASSDDGGTTLPRRTFLKGSGALATTAGLASGHANAGEDGRSGDVPEEPEDGQVHHFEVHAVDVDIVFNRYGLHQPVGVMYALKEDLQEIRELSGKVPCGNNVVFEDEDCFCDDVPEKLRADGDTRVIQPLSLRANRGDVIEIEFHNDLDRRASIHQTGLPYDVTESDGMNVGENPDTTVAPGDSITYRWHADVFGVHFFQDGANQAFDSADEPPQEANLLSRGLFGSVTVLPQGTTWTDPYTGEETQGRVQADIHVPEDIPDSAVENGFVPGVSYRHFLAYYHSPEGVETYDGGQLTYPNSDEPQMVHAINYRADPTGNRIPEGEGRPFYNSWIHGDPGGGDNVYPMYLGDPAMVTAVGASLEENHVHHLHGHRWKQTPPDEGSDTVDSQTVGSGATYDAPFITAYGMPRGAIRDYTSIRPDMPFEEAFQVGVGGAHGSPGDYLFHCHLVPHYGEGMWGIMRVLDKERDGLQKLPNNDPPIPADSDVEGYPEFIPGEFGEAPPFPPYGAAGLDDFRDPEPDEEEALTRNGTDILPGAPYTDPCEPDLEEFEPEFEGETREYTIVALPADVVYNDDGHHDPNGIAYVLEEHEDLVREGEMNPEPLVIRANVGDCVEITFRNEVTDENLAAIPADRFPEGDGAPESVPIEEGGKSTHIHFVSYDVLGSDSLATGFNYRQDTQPGEEMHFRWYADEEGTIFFHDHITGIEDAMHGSFASLVVEPPNSTWLDPYSGDPIRSGTQAIIQTEDGDDFREFCLAYHDFAQLVDRDGKLVNGDEEHAENSGVMAINYRNTPYYTRDDCDPAYVHSSSVHGDPSTPLLEAYEDDPVRIRLWQASYEEQHNFEFHGLRIDPEGLDPQDATSQIIGTSEAFTMDVMAEEDYSGNGDLFEALYENPAGLPIRDYLYGSTVVDDLWDGMWGLFRAFGAAVDHLEPLPDRDTPDGSIAQEELKEMGHPAPYSDFDWSEYGQLARLLYSEDCDRTYPSDKDARQNDAIDGNPPPTAPRAGDPCPDGATRRQFEVSAIDADIRYNEYGDHDPHAIVYALDEYVDEIRDGTRAPMPLSLRANADDCIEVTLTNDVDYDAIEGPHADPEMQTGEGDVDVDWERSERVSLHPTGVKYNVLGSDGSTAGFNWDQTVGPGESITYRWYADGYVGTSILTDHGDARSNRHHGAYGRIVISEEGAEYVDPTTAEPAPQGRAPSAMVKLPDGDDYRAFSLTFADGQYIVNEDDPDDCVVPPGDDEEEFDPDDPCNQLGDPEDHGYWSIDYRSEPFIRRFEEDDDQHRVYDSDVHGDPVTPLPRALLGDPVAFDVHLAADKADGLVFHLAAHQWNQLRGVEESEDVGVDDRFTVGKPDRIEPFGGAGGTAESTGDFIYQETRQRRKLEAGWWGIFRVREDPAEFRTPVQPLPDRAKGIPVDERIGWVTARGDLTGDGTEDLVVLVPDSVRGVDDTSALYVFLGPVDEGSITDLTGADVEVVGTLHDGEHEHGRATVRLSDDLGVDDLDTLLGILGDATVSLGDCEALEESKLPLSGHDFDAGGTRSGDVAVTLAGDDGEGEGDDGAREVAIDVTAADVDEDGAPELVIDLEGGPRIVVDGCESLFE